MFKHILLPIETAEQAAKAAGKGLALAKSLDAKITVLFIALPYKKATDDGYIIAFEPDVREKFNARAREDGNDILADIGRQAKEARVSCELLCVNSDAPHEKILGVAQAHHCDLIMMETERQSAIAAELLGDEAGMVLARSLVPVLTMHHAPAG